MLRIRLARIGRQNQPKFRIVVAEKARPVKGKFLDIVGSYIPTGKKAFQVNAESVKMWVSKGAKPTNTVATLLKKHAALDGMEKFIVRNMHKQVKKEGEENASTESKSKDQPKEDKQPAGETAS